MGKRNELKQVIRALKSAYRKYTDESKDKSAVLCDVVRFFDIQLDETRLCDYRIESINFVEPSIVVVDDRTGTVYKAEYVYDTGVFNPKDYEKNYVQVVAHKADCEIESFYYLPFSGMEERHISTSIILKKDDLELKFTREESSELDSSDVRFSIRYYKFTESEEGKKRQNLLNKVYKKPSPHSRAYNLIYNFSKNNSIDYGDEQMLFDQMNSRDVEYCINRIAIKDENGKIGKYIFGFCFDNLLSYDVKEKLAFSSLLDNLNKWSCPELFDQKSRAAVYLKGGVPGKMWGEFKIFKSVDRISIRFKSKIKKDLVQCDNKPAVSSLFDNSYADPFDFDIFDDKRLICNDELTLPVVSPGGISIEEIDAILELLNSRYGEDEFIRLVYSQLVEFRHRICINRGLEIDSDPLQPKKFIDMSIEKIEEEVVGNRKLYFALAESEFQESTHFVIDKKDIKGFRIRPIKDEQGN